MAKQFAVTVYVDKEQALQFEVLVEANGKVEAESIAMSNVRQVLNIPGSPTRGMVVTSERDPKYVVRTAHAEWLSADA